MGEDRRIRCCKAQSCSVESRSRIAVNNTLEHYYDAFGRDAGYALNGVRQSTLGYDAATGRLTTMLAAGNETSFTWNYLDGSDLKSSLTYPNGLTASWSYGNRGELLQVCNARTVSSSPSMTSNNLEVVSQYAYTYDAAGRRVACAKSGLAFDMPDTNSYRYNARSELTNAAATVDAAYRYGYDFDDIGNRKTSAERGTDSVYTANSLNQYASITNISTFQLSNLPTFQPTFDADGNQTLVKTATGIWSVTYNGENRPVLWTQGTNTISMSFDRMGRRVTKNNQRFIYNGYLQIANFHCSPSPSSFTSVFIWNPTEPVATRPLVWNSSTVQPFNSSTFFYTHDGNKNVSEVIATDGTLAAHYEYAPFGAEILKRGERAGTNPWRFSSEYAEDDTTTVYYNYRHYEPVTGRWMSRDPIEELFTNIGFDHLGLSSGKLSLTQNVLYVHNDPCSRVDAKGLIDYFCVCSLVPYPIGEAVSAVLGGERCSRDCLWKIITVKLTSTCITNLPGFDCFCQKRICSLETSFRCIAKKGITVPVIFVWEVIQSTKSGCSGQ